MKKKLSINAILNMIKSLMGIVFPLITFPYISRILQAENIGKVNYAISIVSYFVLLAMLGIQVYATREGAQLRDDKKRLEQFVSEIYSINILFALIAMIALISVAYWVKIFQPYRTLLLLFSLEIPLTVLGVDWLNSIFEDYLYITIRTIVFQFISLLLVFILVKDRNDYFLYGVCTLVSGYGANLVNYFYTKKYCKRRIVKDLNLKKHLKPIILLFATNLASIIYSSADTTMLGLMTTDYNVGIYSTAAKIYNIFKQLLFAIVVVCLPRFSYMLANESREMYEKFANKIYNIVFILSLPLVGGIFVLSTPIIDVIAGAGFSDAVITLKIKCFAILFAIFAYFNMQLVLIPAKKDAKILKATLIAGIINVIANLILIPLFLENGAAFTTVCSEMIVFLVTKRISNKVIRLKLNKKTIFQTFFSTIIMGIAIVFIMQNNINSFEIILISFLVGVFVYFGLLYILGNQIVKDSVKTIIKKLRMVTVRRD